MSRLDQRRAPDTDFLFSTVPPTASLRSRVFPGQTPAKATEVFGIWKPFEVCPNLCQKARRGSVDSPH